MSNLPEYQCVKLSSIQPNCCPSTPFLINQISPVIDYSTYVKVSESDTCSGYQGTNPLLMNPIRGQSLILDKPPYLGEIPLENIYANTYNTTYSSYFDMNSGQIQYWLPKDNGQVYREPVFTTPAEVTKNVFIDPMGVAKPEYNRNSFETYAWNKCKSIHDSFTHDALEHRQELTEKQMSSMNRREWKYFWTN